MSTIDQYKAQCIGVVHCPTTYPAVLIRREGIGIDIAIYELLQDVPDEEVDFQGKTGDILLGGGSGEAPAMRISIPRAFYFWTTEYSDFEMYDEIAKAYWSMNQAYVLGEGYAKLGWPPTRTIEKWLTEHVLSYLIKNYPVKYSQYVGPDPIELDGSICRMITPEEDEIWNWQQYR